VKSAISTHVLNFGHFDLPVLRSPQGEGWVSDLGLELRISLLLPNSLPNKMIRSKPILVRLRRNPCVLGPVSCPFDLCRESSTNRPLFVQTNPTSKTAKINATLFSTKAYDKTTLFEPTENEPKRTQTNPKRTQFFARQGPSKPKRTQTNPKQTQFFARQGPSKPKRTQLVAAKPMAKPERTQPVAAKPACPGGVLYEAGMAKTERTQFFARQGPSNPKRTQTNPTCRGEACLSRRSALRSRDGEDGTNPIVRSSGPLKPKTNPNEPNLSRRSLLVPAECFTKPGGRRRNEPNLSRRSLLVPAECFTKPGWRSRNEPTFSPVRGPQTQNEPKRTQPVAAKPACPAGVLYEAGMAKTERTQFPNQTNLHVQQEGDKFAFRRGVISANIGRCSVLMES